MTTRPGTRLLTADEFYQLPDPPHGGKMELVRGRVVTHMPVGGPHGETAGAVFAALYAFTHPRRAGVVAFEVGFRLSVNPDVVRAPDVHFVRASRLVGGRMPPRYYPGYPDLAVEVVSPEDTSREIGEKVRDYLDAGTPRVWVVRPEQQTVTVHRQGNDTHTYGPTDTPSSGDAGFDEPGLALKVSTIFEP